jgi:hypothetical protein
LGKTLEKANFPREGPPIGSMTFYEGVHQISLDDKSLMVEK